MADAHPATLPGSQIYVALCAQCHGAKLEGYIADNAPALNNPTFLESATDDFLKASIVTGRPGTAMAGYSDKLGGPLDDAAITRLVAYLREQGPKVKELAPITKPGDPAKGEALYLKSCKTCHGDKATRGDAPHLANVMFQAQASDPFIKHAIVHGRPGTKMLPFAGQLTDGQINDVVAYVRTLGSGAKFAGMLPAPTGKEPLVINPKGKDPAWKPRDGRFVSVDDVAKAYKAGAKMIIVDARPPSDWMRAHIKGAVSIPYHDVARLNDLPLDTWVVAYCACPHHLSGIVVDELVKRGHKKAVVLDEGVNVWHTRGYPMVAAEGVTAPAMPAPGAAGAHDDHSGHAH
ncbi:MAG: Cytochrome c oxidase subunit CcoP [Myxococcales bacterium]|nr:Cytochrome c oxidase subunit CcoP [Myxococcales bacterium]